MVMKMAVVMCHPPFRSAIFFFHHGGATWFDNINFLRFIVRFSSFMVHLFSGVFFSALLVIIEQPI